MTRRASLPRADELFRSTTGPAVAPAPAQSTAEPAMRERPEDASDAPRPAVYPRSEVSTGPDVQAESRGPSDIARPKHGQKVTYYCTDEELTRLERARLTLRAEHRLACDRGRLVRAALDQVLTEFEANGSTSALVRRLRGLNGL